MEYQSEMGEQTARGTVRQTFKYKLLPAPEQEQTMAFVLRRCRELYNAALGECQHTHTRRKIGTMCGSSSTMAMRASQTKRSRNPA